jgi:autotransporter-associated beta strand protein
VRLSIACLLSLAAGLSATPAQAQLFTWNGGGTDNNWSTGANWGGSPPTPNADIRFNGTSRLLSFLDAAYAINSLTFVSTAGAFTLSGSALTIGAGGITQSSATNLQTLNNAGIILAANQTWSVAAGGLLVSAPISGAYSLLVTGTGTLTLTGTNLYTGGTTVNSGTLNISSDRGLGAVPAVASTNLTLNAGTLQWGNTFNLHARRNISLGAGGGVFHTNGFNGTVAGVISGAGALTKTGNGTLTLSGANTYTGGSFLNGGTLNVSSDSALGAVPGSPSTNLTFNGGTLQWGNAFTLNANRNVTLSASGGTFDTNGFNGTVAGVISGAGVLRKTGSGTLTLSGVNTYTGGIQITGGTVNVSADSGLGAASSLVTLNGGALQWGSSFSLGASRNLSLGASGGTLDTNGFNGTVAGVVSGSGSLTKIGSGTLTLSNVNTYTGGNFLNGGVVAVSGDTALGAVPASASTNLTFNGGTLRWASAFTLHSRRNVTLGTTGGTFDTNGFNGIVAGVVSGSGALTKLGTGSLTLSGTNTYTGGTVVGTAGAQGTGGTLIISSDTGLGAAPGSASTNLTLNSNTLQFNNTFTLNANRNIALGTANATFDTGSFSPTVSGVLSGTASLTKTGSGSLILGGANTYSGGTFFNGGTLRVSADSGLGSTPGAFSATNLTFNGGTLQLGATFNLNANRGITLNAGGGTIHTNGFNTTVSQVITGSGGLTKTGNGTVTLTGANTYTGGTTVSGGTLVTGISGINNNTVLVSSGGTLANSDSNGSTGINQAFLNLVNSASTGVVALGFNGTNSNPLNFSATGANLASVSLGATGSFTYSGTLTPNGTTYRLGGGGGTLTMSATSLLTGANSLVVGLNGTSSGTVVLLGLNTYTGGTTVNSGILAYAGPTNVGYQAGVPSTAVTVNSGGTVSSTSAINQTFLSAIAPGSGGVIALGANSGNNLDFSATGANLTAASLGATGNFTYSGTLTPNGNVYRLGGGGGTLTLNSTSLLTGANSLLVSTNGTAAGNVTLQGTNTYTGGTTINSGALNVTADGQLGAVPGAFSTNNITFNGSSGILQFNSSFNLNANRGITITTGSTGTISTNGSGVTTTISQPIIGGGNLVKSGGGTLILSGTNTYTGTTIINTNSGILQFDSLAAIGGSGASVTVNSGSTAAINYLLQQSTLNRFVSSSGGVIAFAGTGTNSEALDFSAAGANLTAASLGATGTFTYTGLLTPNGTTYRLGGGGGTLTVTSNLTGGNGLTVGNNGTTAGTLILTGANTYTGATALNQGILRAGVVNAFGNNSAVTLGTSTTLDLAGFSTTLGSLAGSNSTALVTLGANATQVLTVGGNNSSTTYAGQITGTGSLIKNGTGTLVLSGTGNTYSGTTTINNGVVQFGASGSIGGSGASVTVNSGGVAAAGYAMDQAFLGRIASGSSGVIALRANSSNNLNFNSANLSAASLGATGTFTYSGTLTPYGNTYRLGGGGGTLTMTTALTGANSLVMDGNGTTAGTVVLGATNTYTGVTTVNSGTLQAGAANAIGSNSAVTVASGATLDLNGNNTALGSLSGAGTVRFGTTTAGNPLTNTLTVGGNNTSTVFTGNMTVAGGTGGALVKTGTGTLELTGTSAHTGGTTISQGTLAFSQASGIGTGLLTVNSGATAAVGYALDQALLNRITSGSAGVVALAANSGNTLDFSSSGANLSALSLGATGNYTFSGNLTPHGTAYRLGGGGGTLTISRPLTDGENGATGVLVDVNGTAAGTVVLGAINSYTGPTTVNAGTLQIASDSNLGAVPTTSTPGNVTLSGGRLQASADLSLSANRGLQVSGSGGTIDTQSYTVAIPGATTGTGPLNKTGTGRLTLNNINAYSGNITVSEGTLHLPSSSSTSNLFVLNGGVLAASGSIGALNLASGGTLAPQGSGSAIGLLSATNMTVADGSIFNFDLGANSSSDRLALSGVFDYNPSSSGTISFAFDIPSLDKLSFGDTFTLVTFETNPVNASSANVSKFTAAPRGYVNGVQGYFTLVLAQGGQPGSLNYTMNGYTTVPEPGTLGLLSFCGILLPLRGFRLHRRRPKGDKDATQ